MPDILLTGLPRSGATTVAALIDGLSNAVCLNAPRWQTRRHDTSLSYSKWLIGDYRWQRLQLLRGEPLNDHRAIDGAPLLDGIKDPRQVKNASGNTGAIPFARAGLSGDFILGMKQHALYTALLPDIAAFGHFRIIAVIRHPLDVILSWKSLAGRPFAQGKLPPGIAPLWPEAERIGESSGSALKRMVRLYDVFCQRYYELREHIEIVKYEDAIADPMIVSRMFGSDALSPAASFIERRARVRMRDEADEILEQLDTSVFAKHFYTFP